MSSRWAAGTRFVNLLLAKNPPCKKKQYGPSQEWVAIRKRPLAAAAGGGGGDAGGKKRRKKKQKK